MHIANMLLSAFLSTFAMSDDVSFKDRYQMVSAFQVPLQSLGERDFSPLVRVKPKGTWSMESTEEDVQSNEVYGMLPGVDMIN